MGPHMEKEVKCSRMTTKFKWKEKKNGLGCGDGMINVAAWPKEHDSNTKTSPPHKYTTSTLHILTKK
jgi:hypothetical protein